MTRDETEYETGRQISAEAEAFVASEKVFAALVEDLRGPRAAGLTHDRLEELIDTRGREVLQRLFQDHLDLRAVREERDLTARLARGERPAGRARLERGHHRDLATVVGTVTVSRCALRAPGQANVYPADASLSLPAGRHSHGIRRLDVLEAVRSSYDTTREAISRRCGPVVGKRQAEGLVQAAATDVDAFYRHRVPAPATAEVLLVLSVDAKGIVMRPEALRPATRKAATRATSTFRTRLAAGEKANRKRMATLAGVYDAVPAPRRPHDVIAVPGGRSDQRPVRPGPHAAAKWLTGSVEADSQAVIAAAFDQAEARDPDHARCWVVLVDGAPHQLDLIEAEAARRDVSVHVVLDLVHVLEYLWKAAWCFHPAGDPAAEDWVAAHALQILSGHAHATADAIDTQAQGAGLTDKQRTGADDAIDYLHGKAEYLRYDLALQHGWPIATGVIEGACRHLIGDRFDITGARWGLPGAEALLKLRALIDNGDFDDYWSFHLAREHQRVHPNSHQLAA
jgi:hypothetical protein